VRRSLIALTLLALAAAPAALAATPSPVKKSTTYTGKTSQGDVCRHGTTDGLPCDVTLKTSKDRKRVTKLTIRWRGGPCSANPSQYYRAATQFVDLAISSKARIKFAGSYEAELDGGETATNTVKLNGKFTRTTSGKYRASGDLTVVSDIVSPNGSKTHCETGKVTWSAKPAK
jgi:hypothetical protein